MYTKEERRAQPRRKDRIALVFNYAQEQCAVNTMDVSTTGALIRTPVAFPSGTLLILEAPSLCEEADGVRLLAKVVRASQHGGDPGAVYSGLGLSWIRAYSARGEEYLKNFLVEVLGFPPESDVGIGSATTGDAVYDFPASPLAEVQAAPDSSSQPREAENRRARQERFFGHLAQHFKVESPVVYSVSNMHYRGTLIAVGAKRVAIKARGALPFQGAKVSVRYPLEDSPTSPRIVLHAQTELVIEPFEDEPGMFSALLSSVDELGNRGLFRGHLRTLYANNVDSW